MTQHVDTEADTPSDTAADAPRDDADAVADDVAFARARSRVYDLLAATFDGDVDVLADALERDAFRHLGDRLPVDVETVTVRDPDADALAVGYDNLFVVPGPHFVPPFASAYRTDPSEDADSDSIFHDHGTAGELMGAPAAELARTYDRVGFHATRGDGIPDHLAAIFEFLATLAAREAERRAAGDADTATALVDLQRDVVHRLGWLDAFDDRVQETDRAEGVFASITTFARAFVAWDARDALATP